MKALNPNRLLRAKRGVRTYLSYPDPNEKAAISKFVFNKGSNSAKPLPNTQLNEAFRVDKVLPGVQTMKHVSDLEGPPTLSTVLPNGLTVASQDKFSLMSSFAIILKTGR